MFAVKCLTTFTFYASLCIHSHIRSAHTHTHMNTTTTAQSESATDEEEPSAGLSSEGLPSLPSSLDSDSSFDVLRKELWPLPESSDEEQGELSDEEPALKSTATSGATTSASGATDVPDHLLCDICQQVCALYKCCIPHLSP